MDLRRFALKIRLRSRLKKVSIDAVQACGIFVKEFPEINGKIVQGYCTVSTGEKFVHYWVEDDQENVYDIGMELAKIANPSIESIPYTISKNKPEGNVGKDDHNEELFKLYLEEPKKFWQMVQSTR